MADHPDSIAPAVGTPAARPQGRVALLRVACLPLADWARGGNPALFARLARYDRAVADYMQRAQLLAQQLGEKVVPDPGLGRAERRMVLAVRRRLHRALPPDREQCAMLAAAAAVPEVLATEAQALRVQGEALRREEAVLEQATDTAFQQAAAAVWDLACASPALRATLAADAPDVVPSIERALERGEPWNSGRLRKSSAYLWRLAGRAAAKTTPRGWLGQVALLPLADHPDDGTPDTEGLGGAAGPQRLIPPGSAVLEEVACESAENIHQIRTQLATMDLATAPASTLLALAPLYFTDTEHPPAGPGEGTVGPVLQCYVIDPGHARMRHVVMRRTGALDAVLAQLAHGPRPLSEVETALLGTAQPPPDRRHIARGFLAHLHRLGVLQVCAPPRRHHRSWTTALTPDTTRPPDGPVGWFLDSYRHATATAPGGIPAAAVDAVAKAVDLAARLAALRRADHTHPGSKPTAAFDALDEHPRPLSDLLAPLMAAELAEPRPLPRYTGWRPAHRADSGYARLLTHLTGRLDEHHVDIDDDLLNALGAPSTPDALPPWPLDCVLRPLAPPHPPAVLENAAPAGILDARFADTLHTLHGHYPLTEQYRAFLAAVEDTAGVRFVELLMPPLAERAANAVRTPVLTRWWTGDPDPMPYYGHHPHTARYLPLEQITLRRDADHVIAETAGQRILPIHHATRVPLPPYDLLAELLLPAGHPACSTGLQLSGLARALPDARHTPRVTAGHLILSPAQWRLTADELWQPTDTDLAKARALTALRRRHDLPRYAFIHPSSQAKPIPVDLEAVHSLHTIDRLQARTPGTDLIVEEMLPDPGQSVVQDHLHTGPHNQLAAQLVLRLPHHRSTAGLARAAATALHPSNAGKHKTTSQQDTTIP